VRARGERRREQDVDLPGNQRDQGRRKSFVGRGRQIRYAVTSHDYAAVPHIVARSNLIATVPERIVDLLRRGVAIRKYECPVSIPRIAIRLFWHDRTHRSPLHKWFRTLVGEAAAELKGG
jgi:DNA-binding transcriptional LysR family regulator